MYNNFYKGIINKKEDRPTILFLGDDMRFPSGIGTQTKKIIFSTCHRFNFINLGSGINHPQNGQIISADEEAKKLCGGPDEFEPFIRIHANNGYGNPQQLRQLIQGYKPDAIIHFTDPRFWDFLYNMEYEVRRQIPIMYYAIWDAPPIPWYNETAYASCDAIYGISKQSHAIHTHVTNRFFTNRLWGSETNDVITKYIPHGIDEEEFFPINTLGTKEQKEEFQAFQDQYFPNLRARYDYVVFWNNRNAKRKQPGDVVIAFNQFLERIKAEEGVDDARVLMIMHTEARAQPHGTDLPKVINDLAPDCPIIISEHKMPESQLNMLYNIADVTLNIACNEGFGLSSAESIMAGTPIINNVTGGLQDQVGFMKDDGTYLKAEDYTKDINWLTNSVGTYKKHLGHCKPVFPSSRNTLGSVRTPYIYEEYAGIDDVAQAMYEWYRTPKEEREKKGLEGREWAIKEANFTVNAMSKSFVDEFESLLASWKPKERVKLLKAV